jgi:hypothetical protein
VIRIDTMLPRINTVDRKAPDPDSPISADVHFSKQ